MKFRHTAGDMQEKIELQMTPMIDIVFQLLVFFIMTFKIVAQEGDFNIKMPLAAPNTGMPDDNSLPPMKLRLTADPSGQLTSIKLNDRVFADFQGLHSHIRGLIGDESGPGSLRDTAEIEIDCDYQLHYTYVIQAVTSVSGYLVDDNVIKLIDKIKFAPPHSVEGA